MFGRHKIKTFKLSDLVGRDISIRSFSSERWKIIVAIDTKTGDLFTLDQQQRYAEKCDD